ncbi:syntaxin-8 [Drosophila eugracilis]|uniref:syntaxin-8 n=1 Tax=Drosophila eugracilis TaxID=29029 RepID=UPI0007E6238D|nr:syntaxin-8 [Drosophila eugracilis]XP_017081002.1 syntaxin-8 [Drosophila eugracilis]
MALVDHDSWDIEYEGCERLRHQLLVHLNQRQQPSTRASQYVQLTSSIKSGLEQLAKDMKHLKVVLDNAITWETSPEEELQQRRIDYDRLNSQLREIREKFANSTRSNDQTTTASGSAWQDQDLVPSQSSSSTALDVEALKQRKIEMLEQQNQGLEVLSATLSRQRQLATQLGNEVEDQNNILDNLANAMDRVETGVQRETQSIGQVNRRDSTWGYWLVIIALFVAIIIVVFV